MKERETRNSFLPDYPEKLTMRANFFRDNKSMLHSHDQNGIRSLPQLRSKHGKTDHLVQFRSFLLVVDGKVWGDMVLKAQPSGSRIRLSL